MQSLSQLHLLDQLCPRCAPQKVTYSRPRLRGDVYVGDSATGGCSGTVMHRRPKGGKGCGTQALLDFCTFSEFRPCPPLSE